MSEYAFVTSWLLDAPLEVVWEMIYQVDQWPEWWPYVERVVELAPGQANSVDSVRRYTKWTKVCNFLENIKLLNQSNLILVIANLFEKGIYLAYPVALSADIHPANDSS